MIAGVAAASLLLPTSASAYSPFGASGTIICDQPVVGVWVDAGTQSGWASYRSVGLGGRYVTYDRRFRAPSTYRLTVGCGGSQQRWGVTNYLRGSLLSYANISYYVNCGRGRCSAVGVL